MTPSPRVLTVAEAPFGRAAAAASWIAFVLLTERFLSWRQAVASDVGGDVPAYEAIARAAPGLPAGPLRTQHAERFPLHWLAGSLADATGIGLHAVYRVLSLLALGGAVLAVHATLVRLRVAPAAYTVCLGALVSSAYAVRYLLTVPGMLGDAVFLLALALIALALVAEKDTLLVVALAAGVLARQTALPCVLLAAFPLLRRGRCGLPAAGAAIVVPLALYAVLHVVASRFAVSDFGSFANFTVLGSLAHPGALAAHVGRTALGVAVPVALAVGAWAHRRRRPDPAAAAALAAAVLVLGQPLLLGPAWVMANEARLAALAVPALVVLAAAGLRDAPLRPLRTTVAATAVAAGSLHHLYTRVDVGRVGWVALEVAAAAVVLVSVAWRPDTVPEPGAPPA